MGAKATNEANMSVEQEEIRWGYLRIDSRKSLGGATHDKYNEKGGFRGPMLL